MDVLSVDEKRPTKSTWDVRRGNDSPQRLYWWDEVPPQLQYNKFIRSGYRAGAPPAVTQEHRG